MDENHWLRKRIEATGTKLPVEVTYTEGRRVRIEMDENEANEFVRLDRPTDDDIERRVDAAAEGAHSEGYDVGHVEGYESGYADGEALAEELATRDCRNLLREALLAKRDHRLDDWLKDAALVFGVTVP